jgi:hypothetical protein
MNGRTAYGPLGTAWDRLGPDKFFLQTKTEQKFGVTDCGCGLQEHNLWGMSEKVGLCRIPGFVGGWGWGPNREED